MKIFELGKRPGWRSVHEHVWLTFHDKDYFAWPHQTYISGVFFSYRKKGCSLFQSLALGSRSHFVSRHMLSISRQDSFCHWNAELSKHKSVKDDRVAVWNKKLLSSTIARCIRNSILRQLPWTTDLLNFTKRNIGLVFLTWLSSAWMPGQCQTVTKNSTSLSTCRVHFGHH